MKLVSPSAKGVAYLRYLDEAVSGDTLAKYFTDEEGKAEWFGTKCQIKFIPMWKWLLS